MQDFSYAGDKQYSLVVHEFPTIEMANSWPFTDTYMLILWIYLGLVRSSSSNQWRILIAESEECGTARSPERSTINWYTISNNPCSSFWLCGVIFSTISSINNGTFWAETVDTAACEIRTLVFHTGQDTHLGGCRKHSNDALVQVNHDQLECIPLRHLLCLGYKWTCTINSVNSKRVEPIPQQ